MIYEMTPDEQKEYSAVEMEYYKAVGAINRKQARANKNAAAIKDCEKEYDRLSAEYTEKLKALDQAGYEKRFKKIENDPQAILDNAKEQIPLMVARLYDAFKGFSMHTDDSGDLTPDNPDPKLERGFVTRHIKGGLNLHFAALKGDKTRARELRNYLNDYLNSCPWIYIEKDKSKQKEPNIDIITRATPPIIKTAGIMNDKANKSIVSGDIYTQDLNGQIQMFISTNEAPSDNEKQVVNTIAMRYEGDDIHISKRLSAFDTAVLNAVATLYYYQAKGNRYAPVYITPEEIWRTMNGIKDSRKPVTKNQVNRVVKSFDKMRYTNFFMDISQEIKANYITLDDERLTNGHIETYLLKAEKVSFKTEKGKVVTGYRVENEPILYTYNAAKNHVLFVDYDLLDTSDKTGNEGYTVEFRTYLLQQIELMKAGIRNSHRILYSTIYADTAIPAPADRIKRENYTTDNSYKTTVKREAKNDREKINALLDSWKAKGYIKSYIPVKKGRSYIGVEVKIPANQKAIVDKNL